MRLEIIHKAMEAKTYEEFVRYFQKGCTLCSLSKHNNHPVLYRGNCDAPIVLVGEAPGAQEELLSKPFVGPAGQLLDKIMNAIGLDTNSDMLLTNTVYCRPVAPKHSGKQNYTPKKDQTAYCWPFTKRALYLLQPKIIIACGRTAMHNLMGDSTDPISKWEGRWTWYTQFGEINQEVPMFVMTHPAALIHLETKAPKEDYLKAKHKVWNYMKYFRDTYKEKCNVFSSTK